MQRKRLPKSDLTEKLSLTDLKSLEDEMEYILSTNNKNFTREIVFTYQDRVGLSIYVANKDMDIATMMYQAEPIYKDRCKFIHANLYAKMLGITKIIHIKHHFRSVT